MDGGRKRRVAYLLEGDWDLVRPLGLAGTSCTVAGPDAGLLRHSRHVRSVMEWPRDLSPERVVHRLVEAAHREQTTPVLYYATDHSLQLVSDHREQLATAFRFVIERRDRVDAYADKVRFAAFADEWQLPVPPTRVIDPKHDSPGLAAQAGFPMVLKPVQHHLPGWSEVGHGQKALLLESPDDLDACWRACREHGGNYVLQRAVLGDETRIESYHVYVDADGGRVADFTGRKIRTLPRERGFSTAVEITDTADVRELGRAIIERIDLRGVAKLDFKRDADGRLWLLEINPRFSLWHHPGAVAGVNIPALVLSDLLGRPRPQIRAVRPGVTWMAPLDRRAARAWGVSVPSWLRWAAACDARHLWSLSDPGPLLAVVGRRLRRSVGGHRAWSANSLPRRSSGD